MISETGKIRKRHGNAVMILLLSLLHFVTSVFLLVTVFGNSMGRFDTGAEASFSERILDLILNVLLFPVGFVLELLPGNAFPGLWGYIPFMLNSLIWGLGLYHSFILINTAMSKREQPA